MEVFGDVVAIGMWRDAVNGGSRIDKTTAVELVGSIFLRERRGKRKGPFTFVECVILTFLAQFAPIRTRLCNL